MRRPFTLEEIEHIIVRLEDGTVEEQDFEFNTRKRRIIMRQNAPEQVLYAAFQKIGEWQGRRDRRLARMRQRAYGINNVEPVPESVSQFLSSSRPQSPRASD